MKTYLMKISYTMLDEMEPGICDAVRNRDRNTPDPSDPVYIKIHEADLRRDYDKNGDLSVELDASDLREIISRFDYYLDCFRDSYRDEPKQYLGLVSSAKAAIRRAQRGLEILNKAGA